MNLNRPTLRIICEISVYVCSRFCIDEQGLNSHDLLGNQCLRSFIAILSFIFSFHHVTSMTRLGSAATPNSRPSKKNMFNPFNPFYHVKALFNWPSEKHHTDFLQTHSLSFCLSLSFSHSLTHSLNHSLTLIYSFTHSLTHSFIQSLPASV